MTTVQKVSSLSPKQIAADRANLVKARAAEKGRPRTAKQLAASRANLAKARAVQRARAAQTARSAGKAAVPVKTAKKPQAGLPDAGGLYRLPACGPVAIAEHLACWTGSIVPEASVLALHEAVRPARLGDLLEYLAVEGFPGTGEKLAHFERCDPDCGAPGLLFGVQLGRGYHAVVSYPDAMASWGMLLRRAGTPEEAWWLEWESE